MAARRMTGNGVLVSSGSCRNVLKWLSRHQWSAYLEGSAALEMKMPVSCSVAIEEMSRSFCEIN